MICEVQMEKLELRTLKYRCYK